MLRPPAQGLSVASYRLAAYYGLSQSRHSSKAMMQQALDLACIVAAASM
jgi:hypothetical protein